MLMNGILVLAALGALGACFGLGSFSSLAFLWQLLLMKDKPRDLIKPVVIL